MKKVCAVSLALLLLLAVGIEGFVTSQKNRCRCQAISSKSIPLRLVANFEVFPADTFCNRLEYIVTLKSSVPGLNVSRVRLGSQHCLDPTSKEVQKMYKKWKNIQSRRIPIRPQ